MCRKGILECESLSMILKRFMSLRDIIIYVEEHIECECLDYTFISHIDKDSGYKLTLRHVDYGQMCLDVFFYIIDKFGKHVITETNLMFE